MEATGEIRITGAMIRKEASASSFAGKIKGRAKIEAKEERDVVVSETNVEERRNLATLIMSCATTGSPKREETRATQVIFLIILDALDLAKERLNSEMDEYWKNKQ